MMVRNIDARVHISAAIHPLPRAVYVESAYFAASTRKGMPGTKKISATHEP